MEERTVNELHTNKHIHLQMSQYCLFLVFITDKCVGKIITSSNYIIREIHHHCYFLFYYYWFFLRK